MVSKILVEMPRPEDNDPHGDRAEAIEEMEEELGSQSIFSQNQADEQLDDADPDNLVVFDADEEMERVAEDLDTKPRRVVKKPRLDLSDAMQSHAARIRHASGHQSAYKRIDGSPESTKHEIEFKRNWEKAITMVVLGQLNEEFTKTGGKWEDEPRDIVVKQKEVSSALKHVAQLVGGDPAQMWWPRFMAERPGKIVAKLARTVRKVIENRPDRSKMDSFKAANEASALWNYEVSRRKPAALALQVKNGKILTDKDGNPIRKLIGYTHTGPAWQPTDPYKLPQAGNSPPPAPMTEPVCSRKWFRDFKLEKGPRPWPYPGTFYRPGSESTFVAKTTVSYDTIKEPNSLTPFLADDFMERAEAGEPLMVFERHKTEKERVLDAFGEPKKGVERMRPKIERDAAGNPKLTPRLTKCVVSDASLVVRKTNGWKSWEIAPTLWGMNIRTARDVVEAVAIVSGLTKGAVEGAPEVVAQLATPELKEIGKALNDIVKASGRADEMLDEYNDWGSIARRGKRLAKIALELFEKSDVNNKELAAQYDEYGNCTQEAASQEEVEAAQAADWFIDPANLAELGKMMAGADSWAIIAVATGNTQWGPLCKKLLEYRDRYYFGLDDQPIRTNQLELKKLAAKLRTYM